MNEVVKHINSNISTDILIEHFDSNGNLKYREEGHNIIYDHIAPRFQFEYQGVINRYMPNTVLATSRQHDANWLWFQCVHLLDIGNLELSQTGRDPMCITTEAASPSTTGYINRDNQTIGDDPKIGIVNRDESYACDTHSKFVYEFGSSKAIGVFNAVMHSAYNSLPMAYDNGYNGAFSEETCYYYGDPSRPIGNADLNFQLKPYANGWNQTYRYGNIVLEGDGGLSFDLYPFGTLFESNIPQLVSHIVVPSETWAGRTAPTRLMARHVGTVTHYYFWRYEDYDNKWIVRCSFDSSTSEWTKAVFNWTSGRNGRLSDIDDDAFYLSNEYGTRALIRIKHSENSTGYILHSSNSYSPRYFNGKIYGILDSGKYAFPSELTWDGSNPNCTHDAGMYQDVANPIAWTTSASGSSCGEWYYYASSARNDITNNSTQYSTSSSYLARRRFDGIRRFSSSAYKLLAPVDKGAGEVLKITYTFNYNRGE